jgi:hypothetical protein
MEDHLILEHLCRLATDFYLGSKSMMQLIIESGIDKSPSLLNRAGISSYLTGHVDLIEAWLRWSADKRVSSGWYFSERDGGYRVALYPKGEKLEFSDPAVACAEFIVREVSALEATQGVSTRSD